MRRRREVQRCDVRALLRRLVERRGARAERRRLAHVAERVELSGVRVEQAVRALGVARGKARETPVDEHARYLAEVDAHAPAEVEAILAPKI